MHDGPQLSLEKSYEQRFEEDESFQTIIFILFSSSLKIIQRFARLKRLFY